MDPISMALLASSAFMLLAPHSIHMKVVPLGFSHNTHMTIGIALLTMYFMRQHA